MKQKSIQTGKLMLYCLPVLMLFLVLTSCEFDSDEDNYVHVEKPQEEVQVGINLAGVNPEEIIYVYNNSYFTYSLYTEGKEVLAQQFFLDGKPLDLYKQQGQEQVQLPNITDNEIHELKLIISLKTGSGSLAEYAQYEIYAGEFTFKIKVMPHVDNLNIQQETDENNYLKLKWDKPSGYEIESYNVYDGYRTYGTLLASISNPDENYFIDTEYVYGYKHYTIEVRVKNSFDIIIEDYITVQYSDITEDNFDICRISADELHIKWSNPNSFPCKYVLECNSKEIIVGEETCEAVVSAGDFPYQASLKLYILPQLVDVEDYNSYSYVYGIYRDNFLGRMISTSGNSQNNLLYGLGYSHFIGYDLSTMEEINTIKHNLRLHSGSEVQTAINGYIAICDAEYFVHIYSDHLLTNEISQLQTQGYPFHIASNRVLIEEFSGFNLYDTTTNSVICSKSWINSLNSEKVVYTRISISPDGKYIYAKCSTDVWGEGTMLEWAELYEVNADNTLKLLDTIQGVSIKFISFNPQKSTEAIIQHNDNRFTIYDILTKSRKEIKGEFQHIDPYNGNLLCREYESEESYILYVFDKDYTKVKLVMRISDHSPYNSATLYKNILLYQNFYLDVSKLKEWNP